MQHGRAGKTGHQRPEVRIHGKGGKFKGWCGRFASERSTGEMQRGGAGTGMSNAQHRRLFARLWGCVPAQGRSRKIQWAQPATRIALATSVQSISIKERKKPGESCSGRSSSQRLGCSQGLQRSRSHSQRAFQQRCVVQRSHRVRCMALGHHVAGAAFTAAALGGHTQLELDLVKTHAGTGVAGDFTVRNSAADTNDHGSGQCEKLAVAEGLREV